MHKTFIYIFLLLSLLTGPIYYYGVSFIAYVNNNQVNMPDGDDIKDPLNSSVDIVELGECFFDEKDDSYDKYYSCEQQQLNSYTDKVNKQKEVSGKNIDGGKFVIAFIYFLIWLVFNLQLSILILSFFNIGFSKYFLYLSDWAINSSPMLGVLGTIISFALLVSQTSEGLKTLFEHYFMDAAITTILGGFVYIFNFLIGTLVIHRYEKKVLVDLND